MILSYFFINFKIQIKKECHQPHNYIQINCQQLFNHKNFSRIQANCSASHIPRNQRMICHTPIPLRPYSGRRAYLSRILLTSSNQTTCSVPLSSKYSKYGLLAISSKRISAPFWMAICTASTFPMVLASVSSRTKGRRQS